MTGRWTEPRLLAASDLRISVLMLDTSDKSVRSRESFLGRDADQREVRGHVATVAVLAVGDDLPHVGQEIIGDTLHRGVLVELAAIGEAHPQAALEHECIHIQQISALLPWITRRRRAMA